MRLDRYLSHATGISRTQAHRIIKIAEVQINGSIVTSAKVNVEPGQKVTMSGQAVALPTPIYLMLNKPGGYVCATEDSSHPIVLDLLRDSEFTPHPTDPLQIVGRLDLDTTGLLLLTTDGRWNHKITSPNRHCAKVYRVTLAEPLKDIQRHSLEAGILLRGEKAPTLPCVIQVIEPTCVDITINEGKYHQVKRMFAAVGNHVVRLHRYRVGEIELDGSLAPGCFRRLSADEINHFQ